MKIRSFIQNWNPSKISPNIIIESFYCKLLAVTVINLHQFRNRFFMACPSTIKTIFLSALSFVQTWHAVSRCQRYHLLRLSSDQLRVKQHWNVADESHAHLSSIFTKFDGKWEAEEILPITFFYDAFPVISDIRWRSIIDLFFFYRFVHVANGYQIMWIDILLRWTAGRFCLTSVDRQLRVYGRNLVRNAKLQVFCKKLLKKTMLSKLLRNSYRICTYLQ